MDFEKERASLVIQRDNAFAGYHQAIGALAMLDEVIASQKALSVADIQRALDDGSATIEEL